MKNNKKKLLSIIVPVYNSEKYLERCIKSLVNQTYRNIEIILVDDGSTDNSMKICEEWEKKDKRIVFLHKENGGTASARNYGLDMAKGDYIGFVDSDDYISTDMYNSLYNGCINNDVKISITGICRGNKTIERMPKIISASETISNMLVDGFSCCNKLYDYKLFKNVRFPEENLYEDILTVPYLIEQCDRLFFDGEKSYYYTENTNSKVHSKFNINKMDYFYNTEKINYHICKCFPQLVNECAANYCLVCTTLLTDIFYERKKYKKEYTFLKEKLKHMYYSMDNKVIIPFYKRVMIFLSIYNMVFIVVLIKKIVK